MSAVQYNTIIYDCNRKQFIKYDIIPALLREYRSLEKEDRPTDFNNVKEFIINTSRYHWWSKCEYEIIIQSWPNYDREEKYDVHKQVMMNIDIITNLFMTIIK